MSFVSRFVDGLCLAIYDRGRSAADVRAAIEWASPARRERRAALQATSEALGRFNSFRMIWPFAVTEPMDLARRAFIALPERNQRLAIEQAPAYLDAVEKAGGKRASALAWLRSTFPPDLHSQEARRDHASVDDAAPGSSKSDGSIDFAAS